MLLLPLVAAFVTPHDAEVASLVEVSSRSKLSHIGVKEEPKRKEFKDVAFGDSLVETGAAHAYPDIYHNDNVYMAEDGHSATWVVPNPDDFVDFSVKREIDNNGFIGHRNIFEDWMSYWGHVSSAYKKELIYEKLHKGEDDDENDTDLRHGSPTVAAGFIIYFISCTLIRAARTESPVGRRIKRVMVASVLNWHTEDKREEEEIKKIEEDIGIGKNSASDSVEEKPAPAPEALEDLATGTDATDTTTTGVEVDDTGKMTFKPGQGLKEGLVPIVTNLPETSAAEESTGGCRWEGPPGYEPLPFVMPLLGKPDRNVVLQF